jgi:hypothetical protein
MGKDKVVEVEGDIRSRRTGMGWCSGERGSGRIRGGWTAAIVKQSWESPKDQNCCSGRHKGRTYKPRSFVLKLQKPANILFLFKKAAACPDVESRNLERRASETKKPFQKDY